MLAQHCRVSRIGHQASLRISAAIATMVTISISTLLLVTMCLRREAEGRLSYLYFGLVRENGISESRSCS
mgnify:CR=1 FL=1